MVVSGFISLTASVATCCFPWCFSLVILFQLSLKSCLFEEGVGFVPQKGSCRDAQRAAPGMPEPVHIGCTASKESSLCQLTLHKGEHSISNLQYGKTWEYLPIYSCLSPALVPGMTMPAMTQKVSEVASSAMKETALCKAKHSCPQHMGHRQECLSTWQGWDWGARLWLSSLQQPGSLQAMFPLAAVHTHSLSLLCQSQPPRRAAWGQDAVPGLSMTGTGRGWWPHKLPVRCESKTEGESSSKGWSIQHTGFPTPSGDIFASSLLAHVYTCPSPVSVTYCPWYPNM